MDRDCRPHQLDQEQALMRPRRPLLCESVHSYTNACPLLRRNITPLVLLSPLLPSRFHLLPRLQTPPQTQHAPGLVPPKLPRPARRHRRRLEKNTTSRLTHYTMEFQSPIATSPTHEKLTATNRRSTRIQGRAHRRWGLGGGGAGRGGGSWEAEAEEGERERDGGGVGGCSAQTSMSASR